MRFREAWEAGLNAAAPPRGKPPTIEAAIGEPGSELRRAQVDAIMRSAKRAGKPIQRKSAERRLQRYVTTAGQKRTTGAKKALAGARRVYHRERRRKLTRQQQAAVARRTSHVTVQRPLIRGSGERRPRARPGGIDAPGIDLSAFADALEAGDPSRADDELNAALLDAYGGGLGQTDSEITDAASISFYVELGGAFDEDEAWDEDEDED